ncbi:hypothetical protein AVEN_85394-1 [Araneus ventricosus]|uniref:Endonuclease/exonuclease/phosphatase domain-containing protein n=1 Tax=Araneus ventricosus TaxID=182803 RepID=A0A4Y2TUE8_ARAVE|nr:hypothetical protein AVEN_85394-1 [Araneus ventricosus]
MKRNPKRVKAANISIRNIGKLKSRANSSPFTISLRSSSPYSAIEHNLDETHQLIHSLQGHEDFLLRVDLNAHSQTAGYSSTATRGEKGLYFISSIASWSSFINYKELLNIFKGTLKAGPTSNPSSSVLAKLRLAECWINT